MLREYKAGNLTREQVCRKTGQSWDSCYNRLSRLGLTGSKKWMERRGHAPTTEITEEERERRRQESLDRHAEDAAHPWPKQVTTMAAALGSQRFEDAPVITSGRPVVTRFISGVVGSLYGCAALMCAETV